MNGKEGCLQGGGDHSVATVLRLRKVVERLGVSRSTIYDWMNPRSPRHDPEFPVPIRLSGGSAHGAVGWLESEISCWIDSRSALSRKGDWK